MNCNLQFSIFQPVIEITSHLYNTAVATVIVSRALDSHGDALECDLFAFSELKVSRSRHADWWR